MYRTQHCMHRKFTILGLVTTVLKEKWLVHNVTHAFVSLAFIVPALVHTPSKSEEKQRFDDFDDLAFWCLLISLFPAFWCLFISVLDGDLQHLWHLLSRSNFRIVPTCQAASRCLVHFALKMGKVGRSFPSGAQSFFEMQGTAQCSHMKCWPERHGQTMPATSELKNWRTCATNGCCFMAPPLQQLWLFPEVTSESTLQEAVLEHCMAEGRTWQSHLPKLMSIRNRRVESMLCWSFAPWVVMCATVTRCSQMPKTWHKAVSKAPMIVFLEIARSVEVRTGSLSFSTLKTCTLNTFSFTSAPPSGGKKICHRCGLCRALPHTEPEINCSASCSKKI